MVPHGPEPVQTDLRSPTRLLPCSSSEIHLTMLFSLDKRIGDHPVPPSAVPHLLHFALRNRQAQTKHPTSENGRWLPRTGTEFNKEEATEDDPVLERGLPQAHWILLPGRFGVYHEAVQKKTLFPKCGPGMMYKPGEKRTVLTYNAPFYGILINCILAGDT